MGSFWVWGAITGEKWGSDWVRLGSFGFVFRSGNLAFFAYVFVNKEVKAYSGFVQFGFVLHEKGEFVEDSRQK